MTWEQRWHPLREEWVIVAAHRNNRPWIGETVGGREKPVPRYIAHCPLCPGNVRVSGVRNPLYEGIFVFDNDMPCVGPNAPADLPETPAVYRNARAEGIARVVCYSPEHNLTLAELEVAGVADLLRTWQEQYRELGARPEVNHVLFFENKGEVVGVSNPHPHCQIYATNFVFKTIENEAALSRRYWQAHRRTLLDDVIAAERQDGRRILAENGSAIAFVPYFARYAYETFVVPRQAHRSLADLNRDELVELAAVLREVQIRFDNLWQMPFPYVMALHQAPTDGQPHDGFHFHIEFHPPLRKPNLLKYLAGPEIGGGSFLSDTCPEEKAAELRAVPARHYKHARPAEPERIPAQIHASAEAAGVRAFRAVLRADPGRTAFFQANKPVAIARAPGRLDVMGGIADYSGSLVLQMPIAESAYAAAQPAEDGGLHVVSHPACPGQPARELALPAAEFQALLAGSFADARAAFAQDPARHWAAYVFGVLHVLARDRGGSCPGGWRIQVQSFVPEGKGVSSSAALEVAVLQAVTALLGPPWPGPELASLCQRAENLVVGAPCGIMDQMTSALGRAHQLMALLCQPAEVRGFLAIPPGIRFWGIDSGIRHAVSGSDYTSVRIGAFMGYRILAARLGLKTTPTRTPGVLSVEDPVGGGYLANFTPEEFERDLAAHLPEQIAGGEFLKRFGGTTDPVARIDPERTYAVRPPTAHPIQEHARVRRFAALLPRAEEPGVLAELGALMGEAHAGYSACGLGSDGTDRLVALVREAGPDAGLFGAKITGGGSGGTVAVLGRADAGEAVAALAARYTAETGRAAQVFAGSSPGACATGACVRPWPE